MQGRVPMGWGLVSSGYMKLGMGVERQGDKNIWGYFWGYLYI